MSEDKKGVSCTPVEIKFDLPNITELLENALNKALSSEALQNAIDKNVKEAIDSGVSNLFSYRGPVRDGIIKHITDSSGVDPSKMYMPDFHNLVMNGAKKAWSTIDDERIQKDAEEMMASILKKTPKDITLVDIVKAFSKQVKEDFDSEIEDMDVDYDDGAPEVHLNLSCVIEERYPDSSSLGNYKLIKIYLEDLKCKSKSRGLAFRSSSTDDVFFELEVHYEESYKDNVRTMLDLFTVTSALYSPSSKVLPAEVDAFEYPKLNKFEQLLFKLCRSSSKVKDNEDDIRDYITYEVERCSC